MGRLHDMAGRLGMLGKMMLAAAAGALAAYLLDPDRGRSRRARLTDQGKARLRDAGSQVRAGAEYQKGVAKGAIHRMTEPLRPTREFDDETLVQKVRSEAVGQWKRTARYPVDVEVETGGENGRIVLRGTVGNEDDHRQLLDMVGDVTGVRSVDDEISVG